MAAMGNILVKDDANTPVELTFVPITDTPRPKWRANIAGVPLEGCPTVEVWEEKLPSGDFKRAMLVSIPVMETLGASGTSAGYVAPPKVAYVEKHYYTLITNRRSTTADRANGLKLAVGVVQGASATTATGTLANTAAGDAWKNSTLPGPLFFVSGVIPN